MARKQKRAADEGEILNRWVACKKCIVRGMYQAWEYNEWGNPILWWISRCRSYAPEVELFMNDDLGIHSCGVFKNLYEAIGYWEVHRKDLEKDAYLYGGGMQL